MGSPPRSLASTSMSRTPTWTGSVPSSEQRREFSSRDDPRALVEDESKQPTLVARHQIIGLPLPSRERARRPRTIVSVPRASSLKSASTPAFALNHEFVERVNTDQPPSSRISVEEARCPRERQFGLLSICIMSKPRSKTPSSSQVTTSHDWSRLQIFLVHGTFAEKAAWTQNGSALRGRLTTRFPGAEIKDIRWGGDNTNEARFVGQFSLLPDLIEDAFKWRIVVCHSHGGQVVVELLRTIKGLRRLISGVVFLNTPFLHGLRTPNGLLN